MVTRGAVADYRTRGLGMHATPVHINYCNQIFVSFYLLLCRMWTVRRLLLMLALSAVLPATTHARLLTDPFTTPHRNVPVHGRKLLEEGMDMTCLAQQCMLPLAKCLAESGCMKALLGVQMCKEDPLLSKLKSMCYPFPVYPLLPPLDACVNLAIYSFKENLAPGELTRCAQTPPVGPTCLTGVLNCCDKQQACAATMRRQTPLHMLAACCSAQAMG